ncbi:PspA/IM30 family protein [Paenibacillus sacheonensis]|uniref:PspA/IM30 family protein n=1 Tax=Paenibacillus sacheonensis TaxID=742054 RepID=A0A7X5C495_9BACL|nr:PspA/IM30 family protein [Paenibacillus sacheonensis]MBM7568456.1 phage shock protein A [Paenibacillus sacheonensis]NBC72154.1 PspA/IM30 family protein [Paenibacillus sacheonensis]
MGILNRLFNITQAAANELLDKLEDPAMMMNQYVRGMQEEIANAQHELLKQEALAKGLQQQANEASILAEQSEAKALEAMRGGHEAHAREALTAKLHYEEKAKEYGAWSENAKRQIGELTLRLETAKAELPQLIQKRDELIQRMQQAAAQSRTAMPSFSTGRSVLEGGNASRGFQRMEEKIAQWEAGIQASRNPYTPYGYNGSYASAPNASKGSLVDEQLEQLRKKLPTDEQ